MQRKRNSAHNLDLRHGTMFTFRKWFLLCLLFILPLTAFSNPISMKTLAKSNGQEGTTKIILEGYFNTEDIISGRNLFLGQSWGYMKLQINDTVIFSEGNISPFYYTGSKVIVLELPPEIINPYLNKITITIYQDSSFIKLPTPIFINSLTAQYYKNIINFINIDLNIILAVIYLLLGIFLIVYRNSLLSSPSLVYLGWGFIAASFYFLRLSIAMVPNLQSMTYSKGLIIIGLGLIFLFFLKYYDVKNQRLFFMPTIAVMLFSFLYLAGSRDFKEMSIRFSGCLFIIIALLSGCLIVILLNLSRRKPEGYFFLAAVLIASGISASDIVDQFNLFHTNILRQGIGFFVFGICIAMGIIYRNLRAFDILNAPSQNHHDTAKMNIRELEGELKKTMLQIQNERSAIPEVLKQIKDDIDQQLDFISKIGKGESTAATENMVIAKSRQLLAKARRTIDFARFNNKNLELNFKEVNFAYLTEGIQEKANRLPGRCSFDFESAIPKRIKTDKNRFLQIFDYYLKLYMSESTELHVSVKNISQNRDSCLLLFELTNPGMQIGQPEEKEQRTESAVVQYLIKILGGSSTTSKQHVQCSFSIRVGIPSNEFSEKPILLHPDENLVLLISDSQDYIPRFQNWILDAGLQIDSTNNVNAALDLISEKSYCIIFVDISKPGFPKPDLAQQIRIKGFRGPLFAIYNDTNWKKIREINNRGYSVVLGKNISRQHLYKNIDFFIGETGSLVPLKLGRIEELVEGDLDAVNMVIQGFLTQFIKNIASMREAMSNEEMDIILREAHALKGAAGNLGCGVILQLSHEIEMAVRNKFYTPIPFMIESLVNYYPKLVEYALSKDLILPGAQPQFPEH